MPNLFRPNMRINFILPVEGQFITDAETGNLVQVVTDYFVEAWLEPESSILRKSRKLNVISLRGYSVKPKTLPEEITNIFTPVDAFYINPKTGYEYAGKFTLKPRFESNHPRVAKALEKRMGTEIEGVFEWN